MTDHQNPADTAVRDAGDRYEITVGGEVAGLTQYLDHDNQRIFFHTEVDDRFAGQGLAGILVHDALAATIAAGRRIVPICPYVAKYLTKHPELADSVDPVTAEAVSAVQAR
ncbi:GNAT family N-acetyltransferase [Rhodococcus sp. Q]|uniref:GNAT family N-acetyltransferase n=1 Tax=Rhodococcus sp. Q TaxID=2502252 RepID=UPI0010F92C8C|nr:GNAT family N-acetyltransferase [Rhodococcus sp. Q]